MPAGAANKGTRLTAAGKAGVAVTITAAGLLAISQIGGFEGLRLLAYRDVVGVWTACYGETKGIKPGMRFTKDECNVMFIGGLARHESGMRSCLLEPDKLPDKTYVSFLSLTYNIGVGGFCKSSVARDANAGKLYRACDDLLRFNKAGGRTVQGLVTRRNMERKLCIEGLKDKVTTLPGLDAILPPSDPAPTPAPTPPPEPVPAPAPTPAKDSWSWNPSTWWKY